MFTMDQVIAAQKSQFDAAFGLAATAFEGTEKLIALNVATSKALLSESASTAASVLEAKDPGALFSLGTAQAQPAIDKAIAYGRQAYEIVAETGAEFTKAAEAQAAQGQQAFNGFVEAALKNAPAGTESAASFFKGALAAQQNAQAAMQKAVKQASDMAQQSMQAVAAQATQTVKAGTSKKR
jgi:phasin family protein